MFVSLVLFAKMADLCCDMKSSLEDIAQEMEIGVRTGLVAVDFASEFANLLSSIRDRVATGCKIHDCSA